MADDAAVNSPADSGFDSGTDSGVEDAASDAGGSSSCAGRSGTSGDSIVTLEHGGRTRSARVHVPPSYDPTVPTALVLNFHGLTSNAIGQEQYSDLSAKAGVRGIIAVHPEGHQNSWNASPSCCGVARDEEVDDVGFVMALLDALEASYCIDPKRIYSTGMSNGGFLSYRLACERSDRIAAIASVTGVLGVDAEACTPGRPVPLLQIHGTADFLVLYDGGASLNGTYMSVADSVGRFRMLNQCASTSEETFAQGDVRCERWGECDEGADVELCTVTEGGHTWPGAEPNFLLGNTTTNLDATEAILDFFEAHPMPD